MRSNTGCNPRPRAHHFDAVKRRQGKPGGVEPPTAAAGGSAPRYVHQASRWTPPSRHKTAVDGLGRMSPLRLTASSRSPGIKRWRYPRPPNDDRFRAEQPDLPASRICLRSGVAPNGAPDSPKLSARTAPAPDNQLRAKLRLGAASRVTGWYRLGRGYRCRQLKHPA